jgi:exosortase/archaeosortase family protein
MNRSRLLTWIVPAALLAACWPVGRWYARRLADGGDDAWGLLALATLAIIMGVKHPRGGGREEERPEGTVPGGVVALLAVYAVAFVFVPPLVRAGIAVAALGCLLHVRRWGGPLPAGGWGLLLLGLPLLASLQYYLGYPLRVLAARLTVPLLGLFGVPVAALGTGLLWRGELVLVDAPCSGLRMLWAGVYLVLALAAWFGLSWRRTAAAALGGITVVVAGNGVRSAALFVKETGLAPLPDWAHAGIGLLVFAACAAALASWVRCCVPGHPRKPPAVPPDFDVQCSMFDVRCSFALASRFLRDYTWLGLIERFRTPLYFSLCALAAFLPFVPAAGSPAPVPGFPGWPETFEGRPLRPLPLAEGERRFLGDFPGRAAKFTDGGREILLRWVAEPSRRLHPSADCLRGAGAEVRPLPAWRDRQGRLWGCQEMVRDGRRLRVRERIAAGLPGADGESGAAWTDVSSWYWSALLGRTRGPWWAVTVAERLD